jgi:hypothetical protein
MQDIRIEGTKAQFAEPLRRAEKDLAEAQAATKAAEAETARDDALSAGIRETAEAEFAAMEAVTPTRESSPRSSSARGPARPLPRPRSRRQKPNTPIRQSKASTQQSCHRGHLRIFRKEHAKPPRESRRGDFVMV